MIEPFLVSAVATGSIFLSFGGFKRSEVAIMIDGASGVLVHSWHLVSFMACFGYLRKISEGSRLEPPADFHLMTVVF